MRWLRGKRRSEPLPQHAAVAAQISQVSYIYASLVEILRDQIVSQLESASTNELESVALLAADVAAMLALLLVRASDPASIHWSWWWYPLPLFAVAALLAMGLLRPRRNKERFKAGPHIPSVLVAISSEPQTVEQVLTRLLKDLQATWQINDSLLATERRFLRFGTYALGVASVASVALYGWGLR